MDLAATICTRRAPRCDECPVARRCASRGTAGDQPVRAAPGRFEASNRWLRGRILAHVREADPGEWVSLEGRIGTHPPERVEAALDALAAEGFLEREGNRVRLS
jgi:A/G-specific adenine glycosylase